LDRQRIDKWLWHARVVRTRTAAAGLVDNGLVRLNGARVDAASRAVRIGDVITVALDRTVRLLRVTDFAERRGSASDAASLFEDISPAAPDASKGRSEPEAQTRRPSKNQRRELLRLKRPDSG
jgi:ribosome-associated heat shock protein Hsp15